MPNLLRARLNPEQCNCDTLLNTFNRVELDGGPRSFSNLWRSGSNNGWISRYCHKDRFCIKRIQRIENRSKKFVAITGYP